jgi:hypothetical protein
MKTRLLVPLIGLAISFALPMFGQQKETPTSEAVEKADPLAGKFDQAANKQ